MEYKFNIDKLKEVLENFYSISKITMSIWDSKFNQLAFYPKPMALICEKIKSCREGKNKCLDFDISLCKKAAASGNAQVSSCHIGLIDVAIPIYYDEELIAYIMFGQMRDAEEKLSNLATVKKICQKYGLDEAIVEECYKELPILNHKQISAIAALFEMCVPYFYTSHAIEKSQNELSVEIEKYIIANIENQLTLQQLCEHFKLSVNTLYKISHKFFKTSIKNYIILKRIEAAKHYLTTTQLSVAEISTKTGFYNYNYFIRTFRRYVGYTPLAYRKNFPLNVL